MKCGSFDVLKNTICAGIKLNMKLHVYGNISRYVRIAILVYAVQNKIIHVVTVIQKVVLCDSYGKMWNNVVIIDNLMKMIQ